MTEATTPSDDERRLAELGYKQELARSWSGFSNFAISFTIVSILTGGLASYGIGLANGGPITMAWGWPLVSVMVLFVGLAMAELASAYPTSGGLYWWASELGGPVWGWFTGWFNLIGQIAVTAAIDYGAAIFTTAVLNVIGIDIGTDRTAIFLVFTAILILHAVLNAIGPHLSRASASSSPKPSTTARSASAAWHSASCSDCCTRSTRSPATTHPRICRRRHTTRRAPRRRASSTPSSSRPSPDTCSSWR
jgi:amino acid transporter